MKSKWFVAILFILTNSSVNVFADWTILTNDTVAGNLVHYNNSSYTVSNTSNSYQYNSGTGKFSVINLAIPTSNNYSLFSCGSKESILNSKYIYVWGGNYYMQGNLIVGDLTYAIYDSNTFTQVTKVKISDNLNKSLSYKGFIRDMKNLVPQFDYANNGYIISTSNGTFLKQYYTIDGSEPKDTEYSVYSESDYNNIYYNKYIPEDDCIVALCTGTPNYLAFIKPNYSSHTSYVLKKIYLDQGYNFIYNPDTRFNVIDGVVCVDGIKTTTVNYSSTSERIMIVVKKSGDTYAVTNSIHEQVGDNGSLLAFNNKYALFKTSYTYSDYMKTGTNSFATTQKCIKICGVSGSTLTDLGFVNYDTIISNSSKMTNAYIIASSNNDIFLQVDYGKYLRVVNYNGNFTKFADTDSGITITATTSIDYSTNVASVQFSVEPSNISFDFELYKTTMNVSGGTISSWSKTDSKIYQIINNSKFVSDSFNGGYFTMAVDEARDGYQYFAIAKAIGTDIPSSDCILISWSTKNPVQLFIEKEYKAVLGRDPTSIDISNWFQPLYQQTHTGSDMVTSLMFSAEYLNKGKTNSQFIEDAINAITSTGVALKTNTYLADLNAGKAKIDILNQMIITDEFVTMCNSYNVLPYKNIDITPIDPVEAFVTRLYKECLSREPDSAGLSGWTQALKGGNATGNDVAVGFIFSQEFLNKKTSDSIFLDTLYRVYFDRNADSGGKTGWTAELTKGTSRVSIVAGFSGSVEFDTLCKSYGIRAF